VGHPEGQVAGQRSGTVGGPAYRESKNWYSRGRRIGEIPRGNPDAESEPSIRWDACQEYGGSQGSANREPKRQRNQCKFCDMRYRDLITIID
jgi:hypothetical protein